MYTCFDIAKQILRFSKEEGIHVGAMKLLKLTYISHGYHLGFYDKPLICNEIQAWKYGPVIPELYFVTKRYGRSQVASDIVDLYAENELAEDDKGFLRAIWNEYKHYNGIELSTKTHLKDSPWDKTYNKEYTEIIDNKTIKSYYKQLLCDGKKL